METTISDEMKESIIRAGYTVNSERDSIITEPGSSQVVFVQVDDQGHKKYIPILLPEKSDDEIAGSIETPISDDVLPLESDEPTKIVQPIASFGTSKDFEILEQPVSPTDFDISMISGDNTEINKSSVVPEVSEPITTGGSIIASDNNPQTPPDSEPAGNPAPINEPTPGPSSTYKNDLDYLRQKYAQKKSEPEQKPVTYSSVDVTIPIQMPQREIKENIQEKIETIPESSRLEVFFAHADSLSKIYQNHECVTGERAPLAQFMVSAFRKSIHIEPVVTKIITTPTDSIHVDISHVSPESTNNTLNTPLVSVKTIGNMTVDEYTAYTKQVHAGMNTATYQSPKTNPVDLFA